jgi:hypothetical protein
MTKPNLYRCPYCERILPPRSRTPVHRPEPRDPLEDAWLSVVAPWLAEHPEPVQLDDVLLGVGLPVTTGSRIRIGRLLGALGRERVRRRDVGERRYVYQISAPQPPEAPEPELSFPATTGSPNLVELAEAWLKAHPQPVTTERLLAAIAMPITKANQIRVGRVLASLGRERARRKVLGRREFVYEVPGTPAQPRPAAVEVRAPRMTPQRELFERVSRWLLDVGDTAVSIDEILAGLKLEFDHSNRVRVGNLLVKHLGRMRVRRLVNGHRNVVYIRTPDMQKGVGSC